MKDETANAISTIAYLWFLGAMAVMVWSTLRRLSPPRGPGRVLHLVPLGPDEPCPNDVPAATDAKPQPKPRGKGKP